MTEELRKLFRDVESLKGIRGEDALVDLRLLVERSAQNRFSEDQSMAYARLFSDKRLLDCRLGPEDLRAAKHFLFYALWQYPDKAVLVAKCIKVLLDVSLKPALCNAIEMYMFRDDPATVELMLGITDTDSESSSLSDPNIFALFSTIAQEGGEYSREVASKRIAFFKKHYTS